jgi:hypothetical protein
VFRLTGRRRRSGQSARGASHRQAPPAIHHGIAVYNAFPVPMRSCSFSSGTRNQSKRNRDSARHTAFPNRGLTTSLRWCQSTQVNRNSYGRSWASPLTWLRIAPERGRTSPCTSSRRNNISALCNRFVQRRWPILHPCRTQDLSQLLCSSLPCLPIFGVTNPWSRSRGTVQGPPLFPMHAGRQSPKDYWDSVACFGQASLAGQTKMIPLYLVEPVLRRNRADVFR